MRMAFEKKIVLPQVKTKKNEGWCYWGFTIVVNHVKGQTFNFKWTNQCSKSFGDK